MTTSQEIKDMVKDRYISLMVQYLEGKLTFDEFDIKFVRTFKSDPLIYYTASEMRRYSSEISEIIHSAFLDLEDATNDPEAFPEITITEEELRIRCLKNVNRLIELIS